MTLAHRPETPRGPAPQADGAGRQVPAYGDPDGHGVYGQLTYTDDGERVICHECGQAKRALGTHAWYAHQITAAEYRARHGLSVGRGLAAPATAARFSALGRREASQRALAEHRAPDRARAANRPGPQRAQSMAIKRAIGRRARLGRPLTPQEVQRLARAESISAWAAIAWELLGQGASRGSIARGTAIPLATVHQRVTRYPKALSEPSPESRYRLGERTTEAREGKARADRERRRAQAAAALPPDKRRAILRAVSQGVRLVPAARGAGTTTQAVYGLAKYDPAWASALDAAQRAAAPADCPHGTPTGYRWYRCQCAACRAAKDGQRPAIQTMGAGRPTSERLRAELDATAVRLGCAGLEDLIRQTRHLTVAEVGRLIGRSPRTAAYWRHKILGTPPAAAEPRRRPIRLQKAEWERRRAQLAEAAGFASWEEAINRTAHMRLRQAARELGVDPSGVAYWRDRLSREYAPRPPGPSGADSGGGISPRLDAVAVSRGYSGLEDLIRSTAALPRPRVARMLECTGDTVTRWRRRFGVQAAPATRRTSPDATEAGTFEEIREAKARAAGYPCWREAIAATASLSLSEAARRLEVEAATILHWRRKFRQQESS